MISLRYRLLCIAIDVEYQECLLVAWLTLGLRRAKSNVEC